jgi:hypothetical protein
MTKRTPAMYHFYKNKIEEAIRTNSWGHYDEIVEDLPEDIRKALVLSGVLDESVEESREEQTEFIIEDTQYVFISAYSEEEALALHNEGFYTKILTAEPRILPR